MHAELIAFFELKAHHQHGFLRGHLRTAHRVRHTGLGALGKHAPHLKHFLFIGLCQAPHKAAEIFFTLEADCFPDFPEILIAFFREKIRFPEGFGAVR